MMKRILERLSRRVASRKFLVPSRGKAGEAKIAVKRVAHTYENDVIALKNVNLDIHAGEFVCLLGPSGCGKSTLLYALAGHFAPSGGHVSIDGHVVDGPSPERLLMFQEAALFPWLTVKQNLTFALAAKKIAKRARERLANDYIRQVYLEGFENALPHQLSGGMRMRVSLARALSMDPAVLLMDEPFAPLDAQTRGSMHQLLQSIWLRTRKTVVFVTHDVREALVLGDRVVVMAGRPGRVLRDLEVRLPRPRDPDDELLVTLSRQIRAELQRAAGGRSTAVEMGREERVHGLLEGPRSEGGLRPAAAEPVDTHL
jgi:NitT/TauT family transport system ATP-binding protein